MLHITGIGQAGDIISRDPGKMQLGKSRLNDLSTEVFDVIMFRLSSANKEKKQGDKSEQTSLHGFFRSLRFSRGE